LRKSFDVCNIVLFENIINDLSGMAGTIGDASINIEGILIEDLWLLTGLITRLIG